MRHLLLAFLAVIPILITTGQSCFEKLHESSGFELSSFQNQIEIAADEVRDSLPSNYQDSFKVYDAGFYIHIDKFIGYGYSEEFSDLKNSISSPYYVLVAKQNESKGLFTKFWVEVKLPDITANGCIPNLNDEASSLVEFVLEAEFEKANRSPSAYPDALITALESLKVFISKAKECCESVGDVAQCIECNNPNYIAAKLLSLGFVQENIQNIVDYEGNNNLPSEIDDHANLLFSVNDMIGVDIPTSYISQIPIYQSEGLSVKIYITKDEIVCSSLWQEIQDEIENSSADVIFWHHIHEGNANQLGDEKLFSRVFLAGIGRGIRDNGTKSEGRVLGPDPVTAIIGALGSAFSDAMIQTVSIYFLSDDIEEGDWGEAFNRVNFGSVAWSGITGLFVVNSKMVTVAVAIGAATVEVTYNAFNDPNYTIEQGALDFGRVFISDLIGSAAGGAVGNKLKNVDLSWFSGKALNKLRLLFGNSNTAKRTLIKLCWKLELENITTHSARGTQFENWLFEWLFNSQGFIQTAHSFKGIDFHKAAGNIGTSLKTTIQTSKSGLKNLVQQNIEDLQRGKTQGFIRFHTEYDIDEARLLILVPEENVSTVTQKIQEIITELDPNGLIDVIEVKSFENLLGI